MVTPIWRPERRNRKVGTSSSGYSYTNKMRIPESWLDRDGAARIYHNRIDPESIEVFSFFGNDLTVLYEAPRQSFTYGCSPLDVKHLLSQVPVRDLEGLKVIAFRQPTRKQSILCPVWGRLVYEADFGRYKGPAIILEAIDIAQPIKWSRKMDLATQDEFRRLQGDGHAIESNKREHIIHVVEDTVRNTILYRTLLHELGHWVHWLTDVVRPETALAANWVAARDLYFSKPVQEREAFAHNYASKVGAKLRGFEILPFEPLGVKDAG